MRKLVSFMHVSLDGFVAGLNGEMNWIKVDAEIFDYVGQMIDQSEMAVYGRVTYQMMEAYWPTAGDKPNATKHDKQHSAWYSRINKIIVSRSMEGQQVPKSQITGSDVENTIRKNKDQPGGLMVIFGSPSTTHYLTQHDLVDEFWLFVNPILLGEGIPMFKGISGRVNLKLADSKTFASGVEMLHYEVIRK